MSVVDEIRAVALKGDHIAQYGIKKRSGRYPYGSGEDPFQHDPSGFLKQVNELKAAGKSEKEIAEALGLTYDDGTASSTLYRRAVRYATHKERQAQATQAQKLRAEGKSLNEIAKEMGFANDSSVRTLLNMDTKSNKEKAFNVAEALKEEVDKKGAIDVGDKAELSLGCTKGTLDEALWILQTEHPDYVIEGIGVPMANNKGKKINVEVLHKDDITTKELYDDTSKIQQLGDFATTDGGNTIDKLQYPTSLNSDRVAIRYGDEGGKSKDGTIEIRPGVEDLSLGNSHYAQVRILVDDDHYLKGMALYATDTSDWPDGVDIMFNTNKNSGTDKMKVLKSTEDKENEFDPNNPFGAAISAKGQNWYTDSETGERKLGCINKLKEEGEWEKQENTLSSQFLSKQPLKLVNAQLDTTYADYADRLAEIEKLENPTVRKQELLDFAGKCDSASVDLKAAALPRQKWQVILPVDELKAEDDDGNGINEIYAPNFKNGEKVALVRYPHAGTFEIPICTVNNNNEAAKKKLGQAVDAVGINSKVAERLSGADFDGDTVVVIPTGGNVNITSRKALAGLKDFDPKTEYPYRDGMKVMKDSVKQKEMGKVSNLITDMTIRGADDEELARAVRHSMVVIDAVKHKLDYKQSEIDNGIAELKAKYQSRYDDGTDEQIQKGGASTLLSRRKRTAEVDERQGGMKIDKETGEVSYNLSGRTYMTDSKGNNVYKNKDGTYYSKDKKTGEIKNVDEADVKTVKATSKVPILEAVGDAYKLSSGSAVENAYANYANKMRDLAKQARKEYANTEDAKRDPEATVKYSKEIASLDEKLTTAAANAPKERRAQAIANSKIKAAKAADPEMSKEKLKKLSARAIEDARAEVGASGKKSKNFDITDSEWEAIQNHAISSTKLKQILRYADSTRVKQLAMPKANKLTDAKIARIKALRNSGFTAAEIAEQVGVSTSTIYKIV